jgi:hypothetical protein
MGNEPLTFDIKKVDLRTGEITNGKKVYESDKVGSPSIVSNCPIGGIRCSSFGKGSDGKTYRIDWSEKGKAENVTET